MMHINNTNRLNLNAVEVKPLKKKFKKRFKEWAEVSTSHAIPNMARTNNWIMFVFWAFFLTAGVGSAAYFVITSIMQYLKYETTVSIRRVQELPQTFPAITICNINPFNERKSATVEYLRKFDGYSCIQNNTDGDNVQTCANSTDTNSIVDEFVDQIKRIVANEVPTNVSQQYGFDLYDDMLISCVFNGVGYDTSLFKRFWSNEYGNCYTFNSGSNASIPLLKMSDGGPQYGLRMELTVKPPVDSKFQYRTGLYLVVHNQSDAAFTLNNGINLATGFDTYIGVNRVFTTKLDGFYSSCIKELKSDKAYAQRLFGFFSDIGVSYYDQDICFSLCFQDKLINDCNCSDITTPKIRNKNYCSSDEDLQCMRTFQSSFASTDLNVLCESACPQECETIDYDLVLNSATYPTMSYLRWLATDQNYASNFPQDEATLEQFGRTGVLKIRINYDNDFYTTITENPAVSVESLIGNLGGQLGLFIGISFLSFIEIIEIGLEFIFLYLDHRKEIKAAKEQQKKRIPFMFNRYR